MSELEENKAVVLAYWPDAFYFQPGGRHGIGRPWGGRTLTVGFGFHEAGAWNSARREMEHEQAKKGVQS